jgi:hypothetical protein
MNMSVPVSVRMGVTCLMVVVIGVMILAGVGVVTLMRSVMCHPFPDP